MYKLSVLDFFKVNSKLFKKNYTDAIKLANADSIHDLRVSVKRLNALVQVLNFGNTSNYRIKNNYPHLKLVFKAAATVRDYQVLEVLILQYHQYRDLNLEKINKHIAKFKLESIKDFFYTAKKFDSLAISRFFGIIENHIINLDEVHFEKKFNDFKSNHLMLLIEYSDPVSDKYNLHSARKVIKDLGYLIEMSGNVQPEINSQLPMYKEAGRYLGDWHDRLVLQNFLHQKAEILQIKNGNQNQLMQFIVNEKDSLKNQYFTVLKSIDNN